MPGLENTTQVGMVGGMGRVPDDACAIARSLGVLGERWTFLILREASQGADRFSQFREALGVAPDVLAERLSTLVAYGVMEKVPYQEPGERARASYRLTPPGEELTVGATGSAPFKTARRPLRQTAGPFEPRHAYSLHLGHPARDHAASGVGRPQPPRSARMIRSLLSGLAARCAGPVRPARHALQHRSSHRNLALTKSRLLAAGEPDPLVLHGSFPASADTDHPFGSAQLAAAEDAQAAPNGGSRTRIRVLVGLTLIPPACRALQMTSPGGRSCACRPGLTAGLLGASSLRGPGRQPGLDGPSRDGLEYVHV
jgi:DNA-binding HxlR family transcriptional regulator